MMAGLVLSAPQVLEAVSTKGLCAAWCRTGCPPPPSFMCITARDGALLVVVAFAVADITAVVAPVTTEFSHPSEVPCRMLLLGNMLADGVMPGLVPPLLETGTQVLSVLAGGAAPLSSLSKVAVST